MFASSTGPRSAARRRGIVLVLVLGMLGLMALIGVTFATFAGQSLKNGRNFSQGVARPQAEALMDYALAQLINDTNNPLSALRGHSLLRDMYGNDSVYRGANPPANSVVETGGLLSRIYDPSIPGYTTLHFTTVTTHSETGTPFYNQLQYQTNIPTTGQYHGYDFTRWIVRFPGFIPSGVTYPSAYVSQTFEVIGDDYSGAYHVFTLSGNLVNPATDNFFGSPPAYSNSPPSSGDPYSFIYSDPNIGATQTSGTFPPANVSKSFTTLAREYSGTFQNGVNNTSNAFVLDGRYMRAFNGAGQTRPVTAQMDSTGTYYVNYPFNQAAYGNFRIIGNDPDAIGMDEDYDACDLENWFLAIQSADGQVMIPSFHRPGILMATDWTAPVYDSNGNITNTTIRSKILRPRQIDNSPLFPADPSTLGSGGKLTYDIDNDGDGVTDSVWLDLGFPSQRDPNGKLYKPLFAFMVLGVNGRMPLNTVGNLQARAIGDTTNNAPDTVPYPNTSGQVPYAGPYTLSGSHHPQYSSQVFFDTPLYDHASHLGYSVSEINPKFALQNAPSNLYGTTDPYGTSWSQYDNAGISVALTQLRNILAGGRPTIKNAPSTDTNTVTVTVTGTQTAQPLPNGLFDLYDSNASGSTSTTNLAPVVPGRWGEPGGVPSVYYSPLTSTTFDSSYPIHWYNNPVRAGRSVAGTGSIDSMDDDFDGTDPYLPNLNQQATFTLVQNQTTGGPDQIPLNSAAVYNGPTFTRNYPEDVDSFDSAGQMAVASERARRFTTPRDTAGIGRMVSMIPKNADYTRPARDHDYGLGADNYGRVGYFRYFRPAGMPQEIRYPYADGGSTTDSLSNFEYPYVTNSGFGQRYLMPVLLPAGKSASTATTIPGVTKDDIHNNRLHGYQSALTPQVNTALQAYTIATLAAMPFDWDPYMNSYGGGVPGGYNNTDLGGGLKLQLFSPTINPNASTVLSAVNTLNGPNLGTNSDPSQTVVLPAIAYPIPYGTTYNSVTETGPSGTAVSLEQALGAPVVNGYLDGGLNKDEADEMNLYVAGLTDMPYGPTDLEWLYRMHDVDGASLNSRLSQLAPISFLNPADGLTRRRLFSIDSWELNRFAWANDNPPAYAGNLGGLGIHSADHDFSYNSRFMRDASPSLELINQIVSLDTSGNTNTINQFANPYTTEFLPNPTFPVHTTAGGTLGAPIANSSYTAATAASDYAMPRALDPSSQTSLFSTHALTNAQVNTYTNVLIPSGGISNGIPLSQAQVQTPSLAHLDRKINLNFPVPISNDPAEPIRQKWCRETYQLLKTILPPASVDTPEELGALSQFVVNIIDFRDPDCTMTRFVNTDLEVTDVLTKQASNQQLDPTLSAFDPTWTVSPSGVRFSQNPITTGHAPYDPSLYSPDRVTPFLVQHGMEYSPIALNEVMAYQAKYGPGDGTLVPYQAFFVELVNTLTEAQNDPGGRQNSSAISLAGWDIVVTPDNYGWGRPDPISGDLNPVAFIPFTPNPAGDATMPPTRTPAPTDANIIALQAAVAQYSIPSGTSSIIQAIQGNGNPNVMVIGDYRTGGTNGVGGTSVTDPTTIEGNNPVAKSAEINIRPAPVAAFPLPSAQAGKAQYYWVYLRRPANPFDTAVPNQVRPNKEMVVVDAMRFPAINATNTGGSPTAPTKSTNAIYSAQRLQPYRGGHLVRVDSDPTTGPATPVTAVPTTGLAAGVKRICPPSPAYAYGYSEQMAVPPTGSGNAIFKTTPTDTTGIATTNTFQQSINNFPNTNADTTWAQFPFHDRDFASVAELLLVPGCPPGLFTKQFVEEPYPGNIYLSTNAALTKPYPTAFGTDNRDFASPVAAPTGGTGPATATLQTSAADPTSPSLTGRKDFNAGTSVAPRPTFPYLTDNFYYTAASVAPPAPGTVATAYTQLTTEIGGWTGAGWHKMLEFFEVPSSANGAISTADNGDNYDWYRADIKPGLLNLNLIIDDEVFAGLIDDPRLNDQLAYTGTSVIPHVVNQIDQYGYPVNYGTPIFPNAQTSYNALTHDGTGNGTATAVGRGYVYRDPDATDYLSTNAPVYNYQQVHGLKAAFSDFLKLRHGGSGYLFAHGAGDVGSGNGPPAAPTTSQPVAADRPFRSPSYPDINYTIMRPASLPPTPPMAGAYYNESGTNPALPIAGTPSTVTTGLGTLFSYAALATAPYVQFNQILAPMNDASKYQYVQDPGTKNPYLGVQYANTTTPSAAQPTTDPWLSLRRLAPPYDTNQRTSTGTPAIPIPIAAPFPPPIPPVPARRLFQVPDDAPAGDTVRPSSNASLLGSTDPNGTVANGNLYPVNQPTVTPTLTTGTTTPPSLVVPFRAVFAADNYTPQSTTGGTQANNLLGAGSIGTTPMATPFDLRQHPAYQTEWLQKISNLTTVRTHQFATWITVGFFEVVKVGTPELGIPDVLGQEMGSGAGKTVRYRSFFVIDRTKATGFNPYYPGNFRDCVTFRRRIE